jgi:Secretion system C-terminal sorting domain
MKRIALILIALLLSSSALLHAQVPSSCIMPQVLQQAYERDIASLALQAMYDTQSPDTQLVQIPQAWRAPIAEGLAAIYNATALPERDSVFNLYCVHDRTGMIQTYPGYLLQIDTSFAWTQAWQNLITLTGIAPLDQMLLKYGLQVTSYHDWSFGQYVVLQSDSLYNNRALLDSLLPMSGILDATPNASLGIGGRITYAAIGADRYFDFHHEFGDCPSGCLESRAWHFRVGADCMVEYLGFTDSSPSGFNPLPEPTFCYLSTNIAKPIDAQFLVYPNPAQEYLQITAPHENEVPTLAELHDAQGRKVLASNIFLDQTRLDVGDLAHGIYALVLKQKGLVMDVKHILH